MNLEKNSDLTYCKTLKYMTNSSFLQVFQFDLYPIKRMLGFSLPMPEA